MGAKDVLVVGGAGYVGSHTVRYLVRNGLQPVVFDNLSTGHKASVPRGVRFIKGDLLKPASIRRALGSESFSAVFHFAAKALVGESVKNPALYYRENMIGALNLFEAMLASNVKRVVFSSTAATYGNVETVPLTEDHPKNPCNPYGFTKWAIERMLADFHDAYGLRSVSLRYFNAAGCDPSGEIGEDHDPETHLIPNILKAALNKRSTMKIFGDDYPTVDGTCVRDYVHVTDLAQAHLLALKSMRKDVRLDAFNLGNGDGYSCMQVVDTARTVSGRPIQVAVTARRPGDPAILVASADRARRVLGWKPEFDSIEAIVETAWRWMVDHPRGYAS